MEDTRRKKTEFLNQRDLLKKEYEAIEKKTPQK